ncbi:Hypothetical protein NTJ_15782 [Nesidiocoris tenuis]|uniref:Secreted protein n=1 Tax=Nesidiocoris tenuis TaxID=355587 RepID=A0ABN7BF74_9HEMI|nr:Hypothetical protein NTJ_15782 [Nesidiocoris tenuis]
MAALHPAQYLLRMLAFRLATCVGNVPPNEFIGRITAGLSSSGTLGGTLAKTLLPQFRLATCVLLGFQVVGRSAAPSRIAIKEGRSSESAWKFNIQQVVLNFFPSVTNLTE